MTDRVDVNGMLNRELQYKYFYASYICLVTDHICTNFGPDIISEEENTDAAYFCHSDEQKVSTGLWCLIWVLWIL